jgi:radical SAM domain protein
MSIDTFATVVELLSANGVQVVELSGGECTIHPKFAEMLNLACSKFSLVSVLTNGYLLGVPGKVRDAIMGRDNVAVQVSIDGIERTHDLFREAYSQATCQPVKPLVRAHLRMAVNKPP